MENNFCIIHESVLVVLTKEVSDETKIYDQWVIYQNIILLIASAFSSLPLLTQPSQSLPPNPYPSQFLPLLIPTPPNPYPFTTPQWSVNDCSIGEAVLSLLQHSYFCVQETYSTFDYTSLLYLTDYKEDFQGGRFVFVDSNGNKTVEPKFGESISYGTVIYIPDIYTSMVCHAKVQQQVAGLISIIVSQQK